MSSQLPLGLSSDSGYTLECFHAGSNAGAVEALSDALEQTSGSRLLIEGPSGAGKTHLLQAFASRSIARVRRVAYLPMRAAGTQFGPDALQGLEKLSDVFLDDVDAVTGQPPWERALAEQLQMETAGSPNVVLSSTRPVGEIATGHRWLEAYLRRCRRLRLEPLEVDDRIWALQRHAESRGIELAEDVARYLARRLPGGLAAWVRALDALDYASLANKRRLTKPFIRSLLKLPGE